MAELHDLTALEQNLPQGRRQSGISVGMFLRQAGRELVAELERGDRRIL